MKLPPLPKPFPAGYIAQSEYFHTDSKVRAIQREAALWALEEAAEYVEARGNTIAGAVGVELKWLSDDIRALKEQIE